MDLADNILDWIILLGGLVLAIPVIFFLLLNTREKKLEDLSYRGEDTATNLKKYIHRGADEADESTASSQLKKNEIVEE